MTDRTRTINANWNQDAAEIVTMLLNTIEEAISELARERTAGPEPPDPPAFVENILIEARDQAVEALGHEVVQ